MHYSWCCQSVSPKNGRIWDAERRQNVNQRRFLQIDRTFSKEWHCITVRVLRSSPMKFLYWDSEPLTFIVAVFYESTLHM